MTDIIFAKTRYVYDSYTDFWELVRLSEFPIVYVDEMDLYNPNHLYITAPFNGEWTPHLDNHPERKAKFLLWNLERPGEATVESYRSDNQDKIDAGYLNGVIVSDKALAKMTNFLYIPVGSHPQLGTPGQDKEYDIVHLMCYALRRAFIFDYLVPHTNYAGVSIAPNGWGDVRKESLQKARYMLNIHQDEHMFIEPLRFALAAAYGLPIISEYSFDTYPYIEGTDIIVLPKNYELIGGTVDICNLSYGRVRSLGILLRAKMIGEYSFRKCVERFL